MDSMSPVRVQHLAQNLLTPLLVSRARKLGVEFVYKCRLVECAPSPDGTSVHIITKSSSSKSSHAKTVVERMECSYLVGCDGAGSTVRRSLGIPLEGMQNIQSLMNIHFRCNISTEMLSAALPSSFADTGAASRRRPAMLYFVYNPAVIGVLVAHQIVNEKAGRKSEWVLQLPFFPPHQAAENFTNEQCRELVLDAFYGPASLPSSPAASAGERARACEATRARAGTAASLELLHIAPWTMSAEVAESYAAAPTRFNSSGEIGWEWEREGPISVEALGQRTAGDRGRNECSPRVFLAGDAAHRFPPAGGFGMNTGIQDAHNLAWKLASVIRCGAPESLLRSYSSERWGVGRANTTLALANYRASLGVPAALGMDPALADALMQIARTPPVSFLPDKLVATAVNAAVTAARSQLSWLTDPTHPIGRSKLQSVRDLLQRGDGLELLFPAHDIGFSYAVGAALPAALSPVNRRALGSAALRARPYSPSTAPGARVPHTWLCSLRWAAAGLHCGGGSGADVIALRMSTLSLTSTIATTIAASRRHESSLASTAGCDSLLAVKPMPTVRTVIVCAPHISTACVFVGAFIADISLNPNPGSRFLQFVLVIRAEGTDDSIDTAMAVGATQWLDAALRILSSSPPMLGSVPAQQRMLVHNAPPPQLAVVVVLPAAALPGSHPAVSVATGAQLIDGLQEDIVKGCAGTSKTYDHALETILRDRIATFAAMSAGSAGDAPCSFLPVFIADDCAAGIEKSAIGIESLARVPDTSPVSPSQTWSSLSGRFEAVLLRPDSHVAWRASAALPTPTASFSSDKMSDLESKLRGEPRLGSSAASSNVMCDDSAESQLRAALANAMKGHLSVGDTGS